MIAHRGKDLRVLGHLNPSYQWDVYKHSSFSPQRGPERPALVSGCCTSAFCYIDRPERPGCESRPRTGFRAKTSGTQGRVYAITPQIELVDQSVIQCMFLLSRLWAKILFDSSASHSSITASSVDILGFEVETLEESLHVSSPLGIRVRIDHICRNCELEISGILLKVDLR